MLSLFLLQHDVQVMLLLPQLLPLSASCPLSPARVVSKKVRRVQLAASLSTYKIANIVVLFLASFLVQKTGLTYGASRVQIIELLSACAVVLPSKDYRDGKYSVSWVQHTSALEKSACGFHSGRGLQSLGSETARFR